MRSLPMLLFAMVVLGVPYVPAHAQNAGTVEAAEHARLEAVLHNDIAALKEILADEWVMTSATGDRLTKRQYLDQLSTGRRRYDVLEHRDLAVATHGPVAVLTGETRAVWRDPSGEHQTLGRFTHVYLLENGRWLMLTAHVSSVAPPAGR